VTAAISTTCPYCGVGCGVLVTPRGSADPGVAGDPKHPSNFGRLCSKGSALGETVSLEGRLLYPEIGGRRVAWDEALDTVAQGFSRIVREHGPDSVALYVSGQLLTEDYYVANKLMKGYIGSANIDTNSRLCMSSAVAGHKRAFGEDVVPVEYRDLELADLIVLVGSNTAWCHPVLFQRIVKAREQRPELKVVVLDPRRTATCDIADLHLPLKAGSDVWLFNGLLAYLEKQGLADQAFVDAHTSGAAETLVTARDSAGDPAAVARACGVEESQLCQFYELFARTEKVVTAFSMGVNQSSSGTDKVNAIINCHLYTGRIGRPGLGPFSITGQPNAMGGREVGGLANMLASHMDLGDAGHRELVQGFWNSPRIADRQGLKAVDLFKAIGEGKVKAVWVMATNPIVSLPDADSAKAALSRCELVVSSDVIRNTDTNAFAHILLPAAAWGEKEGTVTNSERRVSRQRAFLPLPGEARPDWWIVSEVAKRMGYAEHFDYDGAHAVFDEHARLSAHRNDGERVFNLKGLTGLSKEQYDAQEPVQWPLIKDYRPYADGRFSTPDRRARLVPTPPRAPQHAVDGEYPLSLNTGRIRDQWHTMTRTGKSAKLASHIPEPYIDLHPHDALLAGVRDGELARLSTRWGSLVARLKTTDTVNRGSAFVPIHWNAQHSSDARVGAVVNPVVDPVSGEPEFKHTPARVEPFGVDWHGFIFSRAPLAVDAITWWTRIQGAQFIRYELAGRGAEVEWSAWSRQLLGVDATADWLEYSDASAGLYRGILVEGDRIKSCIFVSPRPDLPARAWLAGLFAKKKLADEDRVSLMLGEPIGGVVDAGPTVCSCFGVGRNTIVEAIRKHGLKLPGEVTARLKAGGNCGSCLPEIRSLIASCAVAA
jgi:assimilatory nitrate reductase catalytic subunit